MIRYGDLVATARVIQPRGSAAGRRAAMPASNQELYRRAGAGQVAEAARRAEPPGQRRRVPAARVHRRAGSLPSPQEIRDFLADNSPDKRDRLIDAVVERPEFADHWAHAWATCCGTASATRTKRPTQSTSPNGFASRSPRTSRSISLSASILTVSGKRKRAIRRWIGGGGRSTTRTASKTPPRLFWACGSRARIATTIRSRTSARPTTGGSRRSSRRVGSATYGSVDEIKLNEKGGGQASAHRADADAQGVRRAGIRLRQGEDPRQKLVDWMTAPDNPYFARALVNRVWGHYLGVGLVDPLDDMRATNPASEPGTARRAGRRLRRAHAST